MAWSFLCRALLALGLEWSGSSSRFAPDEATYEASGWGMALYWAGDVYVAPWRFSSDQPLGYFYINALAYYLFGQTEIPLKLLNCLIGVLSGRYTYLLARELFSQSVARRAVTLYLFFPSLVLWSALNIRDVWVVFLIIYVSWKSLVVLRGYSHGALLSLLGAVAGLSLFRDYLFFVVAIPPLVALVIGRQGHLGRNFVLAAAAGVAILWLQAGLVSDRASDKLSLEAMSKVRRNMAFGGSSFHEDVDISTPAKALAFLPTGIVYFLFSPFPWQITSFLKVFSVPEMLLMYGLAPSMWRGLRHILRHRFRESLQVLMLTALLTVSYSLGAGNVGTLYRHRAQAIVFYLMFAAVGLELKSTTRARKAA